MHHVQTLKDAGNSFSKRKSWSEPNFPSVLFWEGHFKNPRLLPRLFLFSKGRSRSMWFRKVFPQDFEAEGIHLELRTSPSNKKKGYTNMLGEISASDVDRAWKGWILYLFIYSKFGYHSSGQVRFPKEQKLMFRFIFKFSGWNQIILRKRTRLLIHWRRQFHCSPKKVTFPSIESLHKAYTLSSKLVEPVSPSLTCKYHRSIQILYQYLYRITLHANECKPVFLPLPTSEAHWTRGLFLGAFLRGRGICAAQPPEGTPSQLPWWMGPP